MVIWARNKNDSSNKNLKTTHSTELEYVNDELTEKGYVIYQ